jgi:hypothetical protein
MVMTLKKLSMQGASIILVAVMLSSAIPASLAETGTHGLLMPLPQSLTLGSGMLSARHPHNPSLTTVLFDNFTTDTKLNTTIWTVNGPVSNILLSKSAGPSAVIGQPILSFSNKTGMTMSNVTGSHQATSIQSADWFSTPFVASTRVLGKLSNGNPFVFGISTSDGSKNMIIAGNLNSSNPYYGINYGAAGGPSHKLVSNPEIGKWYKLYISVNSTGYAKLTVLSDAVVLGEATTKVGTGHFYVMLGQFERSPNGTGQNQANWEWAKVTS